MAPAGAEMTAADAGMVTAGAETTAASAGMVTAGAETTAADAGMVPAGAGNHGRPQRLPTNYTNYHENNWPL
jgi:hypothetical protein